MKKFFAFLLTFAMLFSLAMPAMAAEDDTKTIYFDNTDGWTTVNAYAASGSADTDIHLGEWPGTEMTKVEGETSIYSIEVPTVAVTIIFNNGTGTTSTDSLTIPTDGKNLYSNGTWSVYGEGGSANDTSKDVTATYTPTPEAKWGTSKDDLTNSGTLAEAIAAAGNDSGITYIQLQKDVTTDTDDEITEGVFTLDLNGKTITNSGYYGIHARNSGTQVTLTDTATGGEVISTGDGAYAVAAMAGGKLVINGGSYTGHGAVYVSGGVAEINDGTFSGTELYAVNNYGDDSTLIIRSGTFNGYWSSIASEGTTTIKGGTFSARIGGHIEYIGGTLDLSEYDDVNGLTLTQGTNSDLTVSDATIKLPDGYVFKDDEDNTVTTLASLTTYTIGAVKTYTVTIDENIENGTVTVDPSTYTAGQTVDLVVTPAKGYELDKLTVTNDDTDEEVTVTNNSFVMPEANVTVTATFKKITYNVNIADGITGGTVTVDKTTAAEGEIVNVTVKAEAGYAYTVGSLTVTETATGEKITVDEASKSFVMPASAVTVTASFEKLPVTSANIVWGNMSFTYDDTIDENTNAEKGWIPAAEAGAGTVTVKNTGETAFTAKVTYTAVKEYAEITGTFDADSADLAAEASKTFTLTLKNKPNKAINAGTKIGSVTIEIVNDSGSSDEDESDVTIVTDEQGLKDAIAQGGKIKLGESFTMASNVKIYNNVTLDLNSETLTFGSSDGFLAYDGATLNVSNGTIIAGEVPVYNYGGTVSVENCTLTGRSMAYYQEGGASSLRNCIANGEINIAVGGTITLYENITFGHGTHSEVHTGIGSYGGSVICHFDPTGHIKIGSLSDNGDGTWTVSPEAAG